MNLTNVPEELHQIKGMQNDLQSFFKRTRPSALRRLQHLEKKEETKSNSSHKSRKKTFSRVNRDYFVVQKCSLDIKASCAALEQKLKFSDSIKE